MTSQMYAIQSAAFGSAGVYQPPKTDSTPDHPPVHKVDLKTACVEKKKVVANLPNKCEHCSTPFNAPDCIVEIKTGDVMAYCRGKDGCGRSQVRFVGVNTSIPRYRKVCVFKTSVPYRQPNELEQRDFDIYTMHGIQRPETLCDTCGQRYDSHPLGYDHNVWLVDGFNQLELPADSPIFRDGRFVPFADY